MEQGAMENGITLRQFIDTLEEIARDGNDSIEVVVRDEKDESATPTIGIQPDSDGVRRFFIS
jgi:hypothetical protein